MLDGEAGGGAARANAELAVDRGQVGADRARAEHELLGHLGVGEALGHQAQHRDLAGGQAARKAGAARRGRVARCGIGGAVLPGQQAVERGLADLGAAGGAHGDPGQLAGPGRVVEAREGHTEADDSGDLRGRVRIQGQAQGLLEHQNRMDGLASGERLTGLADPHSGAAPLVADRAEQLDAVAVVLGGPPALAEGHGSVAKAVVADRRAADVADGHPRLQAPGVERLGGDIVALSEGDLAEVRERVGHAPAIADLRLDRQALLAPAAGDRVVALLIGGLAEDVAGHRLAVAVAQPAGQIEAALAKAVRRRIVAQVGADGSQIVQREDQLPAVGAG